MSYKTGFHQLKIRAIFYTIIILILCSTFTYPVYADTLPDQIDALLKDACLNHGIQGMVIKSLKTGMTLYERNADIAMMPASNLKLLVSAAVLDRFGPDFTFGTDIYIAGSIAQNGVVKGDIILKGGGDPVLESADIEKIAHQLKRKGISKITGNILVDDTLFDGQRLGWGWSWDDIPYYYSPQISALNVDRNTVKVYAYPGKVVGAKAIVKIIPETGYMTLESSAITGKIDSKKDLWVYRKLGKNTITLTGSIPLGSKVSNYEELITVEEPAIYAGYVLEKQLSKLGININGGVKAGKSPIDAKLLYAHDSPPLSQILALLNKPSDNLVAEVLLKDLGVNVKGQGTTEAGILAEKDFAKQVGLDMSALCIIDGSGLSRQNYLSPRNLLTLLSYMYTHKYAAVYMNSLPVAGVDGTLRNRLKGTLAEKNVKAKSGYISRASCLSGYINTKSGEPLVFTMIMNNHLCENTPVRAVQDKICNLLADLP